MSGPQTSSDGKITKATERAAHGGGLIALLEKMKPELARAVPKHISSDKLARIVLTALRMNPQLAQCTPQSFLGAVMAASVLGLEPNTPLGHAYLVPYKQTCTLILGYFGLMELARRSGTVTSIYAHAVFAGDVFRYELGLQQTLTHEPKAEPDPAKLTHVYAVAKLKDGDPIFVVLTRAEVEGRRKRSMAGKSGPWVTDFIAMAKKSAVRALWPWLPKSTEMATAQAVEDTADRGANVLAVLDIPQQEAAAALGADTAPTVTEGETTYESATGEVVEEREPGSDG